MSQKKLDKAIRQLEDEIRVLQLAIARLRELQREKPARAGKIKPVAEKTA